MIFLTGGTGMLGAHLLVDITKSGVKVRALKRKNSDMQLVRKIFSWYSDEAEQLFQQIEWIEGDLLDRASLREGMESTGLVIHAAARLSFDQRDRASMLYENTEGTKYLVDLAMELGIPRFCHVSSIAALGDTESGIQVNEDFSWKNDRKRSAYAESKFQSEMEVWRGVQEGLHCVIVNPSVILGPGNWNSGSPRFFQTIQDGLKFYPPGTNGFVDVRDVSKVILALVNSKEWEHVSSQRYVLSAENRSYRDVFGMIADALDQPVPTIRANRFLLTAGWRISGLTALLTGKRPSLTRDTARSSAKVSAYDGSKIRSVIPFDYTPLDQTIRNIGKIFREDHSK
jgi:nucleoside-diphosphate-sugar epimerase